MKKLLALLAGVVLAAATAAYGAQPNPVNGPTTTTVGHCATWANTTGNQLADLACSGSVSVTAANPGIIITPSPGTSAFTIGLGAPTLTTLGGVEAINAVTHQWITSISTGGVPALSQPGFPDISGSLPLTQLATEAANTVVGNGTGSMAVPTALAMPSCATASTALQWTSGTGFGCGTITSGGAAYYAALSSVAITPANRSSFQYNARDFGALGDGSGALISSVYGTVSLSALAGTVINGQQPFQYLTNQAVGLTFSMTSSATQASTGAPIYFTESLSDGSLWAATVALWQDPHHGNYLLIPGMTVTDNSGCVATNTTISSIDRNGNDSTYGSITLSLPTSSACASGTIFTFTVTSAQLSARTLDWLGIQAAMANSWQSATAGINAVGVRVPAGNYIVGSEVINSCTVANTSGQLCTLDLEGDGVNSTYLSWPTDLGVDFFAIGQTSRGSYGGSYYANFQMQGDTTVNGGTRVFGQTPNFQNGIGMSARDIAYHVWMFGGLSFNAGFNMVGDHNQVIESIVQNAGCGVEMGSYTPTFGNQVFRDDIFVGDTIASFCLAQTGGLDSFVMDNVHTGSTPFSLFREVPSSNVTTAAASCVTNATIQNMWIEGNGNGAFLCSNAGYGNVAHNTFIGGGSTNIGPSYGATWATGTCTLCTISGTTLTVAGTLTGTFTVGQIVSSGASVTAGSQILQQLTGTRGGAGTYQLSASSTVSSGEAMTFSVGVLAMMEVNEFYENTMIGTEWGAYANVSDAVIECVNAGASCAGNRFVNDAAFVLGGTSTIPPFKGAAAANTFDMGGYKGAFITAFQAQVAGVPMGNLPAASAKMYPYTDGNTFVGVTAAPCVASQPCAVFTEATDGLVVPKANGSGETFVAGWPVAPTDVSGTFGFVQTLDQTHAVGHVTFEPGTANVQIALTPSSNGGGSSFLGNQTAAGTGGTTGCTAITAYSMQFSTVASGNCIFLPQYDVQGSVYRITVASGAASSLGICPQANQHINALSAGTCYGTPLAAGSSITLTRASSASAATFYVGN
jgi:hypothetical protein